MHLGTLANFVFYIYNEALSGYLPCVKILLRYVEAFQRYGQFTLQTNFSLSVSRTE